MITLVSVSLLRRTQQHQESWSTLASSDANERRSHQEKSDGGRSFDDPEKDTFLLGLKYNSTRNFEEGETQTRGAPFAVSLRRTNYGDYVGYGVAS